MQKKYNGFLKSKNLKYIKGQRKKKKKEKRHERENSTELQKLSGEAEVYNNNKKCERIHTQTHTKSEQSNKNKVQQIDPVNKGNQKLYLSEQN